MDTQAIQQLALFFPPFLFSLCAHEWAHAWVATRLGDGTAKALGRLSLSPMAHADPFGTVILPGLLMLMGTQMFFGWAKPVPVNDRNFRKPIRDMAFVAAAGPACNLILAFLFAAIGGFLSSWFRFTVNTDGSPPSGMVFSLIRMLQIGVMVNLFLALFNLIPLNPLDGSRILRLFVPLKHALSYDRFQNYGGTVLMGIIMLGWVLPQLSPLRLLVIPIFWISDFLHYLFGF